MLTDNKRTGAATANPVPGGVYATPSPMRQTALLAPLPDLDPRQPGAGRAIHFSGNLLAGADWQLARSGVVTPVASPTDTPGVIRAHFPAVEQPSDFSLLYQCPEQTTNTEHRFTVYLRGENGGETVWLSHSPTPVQFTRQACILTRKWQRFSLTYHTSAEGPQYVHIGIDLRDPRQAAVAEQTIFVRDGELFQTGPSKTGLNVFPTAPAYEALKVTEIISKSDRWRRATSDRALLRDLTGRPLKPATRRGWRPGRLITIARDLSVLEVTGDDGTEGLWLFDGALSLLARSVRPDPNSATDHKALKNAAHAVAAALKPALFRLLTDTATALDDPLTRSLLHLRPSTRCDLLALAWPAVRPPDAIETGSDRDARIARILALNWLEVTQNALKANRLELPALSHAGLAFRTQVVVQEPYRATIHVWDTRNGPPWILMIDTFTLQHRYYNQSIHGIVFPMDWTFIPGVELNPPVMAQWVYTALLRLLQLGPDAATWMWRPTQVAILGRPPYWQAMGHQVWNTNSTLLHAIEEAERQTRPPPRYWDIAAAAGIEVFGPIEDTFPELTGRVRRDVTQAEGAFLAAARTGETLLFDVCHEVPKRLRNRMRRSVFADPEIQAFYREPATAAAVRDIKTTPVVILGLRLQNRTVPDLLDLYVDITERLARLGPLTVILDGLTASPNGRMLQTYSVPINDQHLLEQEHDFVTRYGALTSHMPVTVISTVGQSIRRALFWLGFGDIFIAPHGTGVMKYRWIHNIPGMILTSSQNVRFGYALGIYDTDGNVEEPEELLYTDPAEVTDILPDNQQYDADGRLVDPWWLGLLNHNFEIRDKASLLDRIALLFRNRLNWRARPSIAWMAEFDAMTQEITS